VSETFAGADAAQLDQTRAAAMETAAGVQSLERLKAMRADAGAGWEPTGHQAVDAAVRAVHNATNLPVAEQFAAYEAAHETLREVLGSIEE
jgi:hypothetical protein